MGRLIDADKFKEYIESGVELAFFQEPLKAKKVEKMADAIITDIDAQPTVEAILKAEYENRLKADLVAMLEELKEQLREMHEDFFETEHFDEAYGVSNSMDIIQEKINALKENKNGNNN